MMRNLEDPHGPIDTQVADSSPKPLLKDFVAAFPDNSRTIKASY
jgi:hypothetical protein